MHRRRDLEELGEVSDYLEKRMMRLRKKMRKGKTKMKMDSNLTEEQEEEITILLLLLCRRREGERILSSMEEDLIRLL